MSIYREFKIRLKRDAELFTQDFQAENGEFDPAKVVTGDVEGACILLILRLVHFQIKQTRI